MSDQDTLPYDVVVGARTMDLKAVEDLQPCPDDLNEAWIDIELKDGWKSRTIVIWPKSPASQELPLVVYFFGGGFMAGNPHTVIAPARGFASLLQCVVACPSYKLAPENPFPAPVQTGWEVCAWLSEPAHLDEGILKNAEAKINLDLGFVVGGLSAGGSIAGVVGGISVASALGMSDVLGDLPALKNPVTGIFAGIPFFVEEESTPEELKALFRSRKENDGPEAAFIRPMIATAKIDLHSPWFSPFNLPVNKDDFAKHHPKRVFTYGGEKDPFRDDSVVYSEWLKNTVHVDNRHLMLSGVGHIAWVTMNNEAYHTKLIKETTLDGMAWLLQKDWDKSKELPY
ncbi:alpha/beta-hydrolase [Hypoxylon sp. FL0543]|nr:alpha/beta-hydrolase [Hypoxylon sp. FL0543]